MLLKVSSFLAYFFSSISGVHSSTFLVLEIRPAA